MPAPAPRQYSGRRSSSTHGWQWRKRQPGSFFVPTLAPYVLMAEGLRTANDARVKATARACVYKDLLGVMFTVR